MYTDYFGFREKPFSITPDPRFFYTNSCYQEAYTSLLYGIYERRGFMVLTGEIGTGKTTLLRRLMENMESHIRFAYLCNTMLTFEELLDLICQEFRLPVNESGRLHKIHMLNQFLTDQLTNENTVVLLIDEAQNLRDSVLGHIGFLSNLETTTEKLLQIVLVGQPELEIKLNCSELRQIKQRIAIRCRLERLDTDEVGPFIDYRLSAVGYKRQQLFTPDAVREIAYYSKGFPRLINILSDNALLIAYATSQKTITTEIVREAAEDLRLEGHSGDPIAAQDDVEPSHLLRSRKRPTKTLSRTSPYNEKLSGGPRSGWRMVMVMLILGVVGVGFCTWWLSVGILKDFKAQLSVLPLAVQGTFEGWIGDFGSAKSRIADDPKVISHLHSTGPSAQTDPASRAALWPHERSIESQDSRLAPAQSRASEDDSTSNFGGHGNGGVESVATPSEMAGWRQRPITVQSGSTVVEIAAKNYGTQRNLGLDLMKEYNTHIENLNRIIVGQRLWLPPISPETLVRRQPDGSYSLILASLRNPQQSTQLAHAARLKGYDVVVTPRRVSDDLMLYRVEINGLENVDAAHHAWEIATANQWIAFPDNNAGKRF
jgi:general secretion pathway protein A